MDLHVERARPLGHLLANLAEPQNSKPLPVEPRPHELQRAPPRPRPGPYQPFAFRGAPSRAENQQHRDFGGGDRHPVRRIADPNTPLLAGRQIDMVGPHRKRGNNLDRSRHCLDRGTPDLVGHTDQDRVHALGSGGDLLTGQNAIAAVERYVIVPGRPRLDLGGQAACDEQALLHGGDPGAKEPDRALLPDHRTLRNALFTNPRQTATLAGPCAP